MKKKDILFIIIVAALIAAAFGIFQVVLPSQGREIVIEEGNELVGVFPLEEERIIEVQGPLGISTVVIENGEAYMLDSPCPNKVCIAMGHISEPGDTIICIPNRVYIRAR
ncbi:MAG: NusG domain II-containing protein [Deltaproteobacteria bacterium]|nr:NusG domain II-containing protein [Candidatus Zymogenaceae bacterium]